MPPSDYRAPLEAAVLAPMAWTRLRAWWNRLRHRGEDSVEGHRVLGD